MSFLARGHYGRNSLNSPSISESHCVLRVWRGAHRDSCTFIQRLNYTDFLENILKSLNALY